MLLKISSQSSNTCESLQYLTVVFSISSEPIWDSDSGILSMLEPSPIRSQGSIHSAFPRAGCKNSSTTQHQPIIPTLSVLLKAVGPRYPNTQKAFNKNYSSSCTQKGTLVIPTKTQRSSGFKEVLLGIVGLQNLLKPKKSQQQGLKLLKGINITKSSLKKTTHGVEYL